MGHGVSTTSTNTGEGDAPLRIALLWRGDPEAPPPVPAETRHRLIFAALADLGAAAEPVVWADGAAEAITQRLLAFDGVLAWVDPISDGQDRGRLDPALRRLAEAGVWVSAHPDVILKMGVKEVLHRTRSLGWGADTYLYETPTALRTEFPARLAASGPRVLKQNRGNGGLGVWKVELAGPGALVRVLHARRGSVPETLPLEGFLARCEAYFADGGKIVDQAFQPRLPEGMIRCYLSGGQVVGYGQQLIKALVEPPPDGPDSEAAQPGPRIMHPPEAPPFQRLRRLMQDEWVPGLQRLLAIETDDLPAIWDADFLFGPRTAAGEDTYVLCEINVSSVAPYPDSAAVPAARAAVRLISARRCARRSGS